MIKKRSKSAVAAVLAVMMVLPLIVSCSDTCSDAESSTATQWVTETEEDSFLEIDSYVSDLVASSGGFDGSAFNIISSEMSVLPETMEETGSLENDTLYMRQRDIEELFDVKMELSKATGIGYEDVEHEINDLVRRDVMSDSRTYDLIEANIMLCGTYMLESDLIQPSDNFDAIDPEQSWWISGIRERYTICDKLYYLTGKINVTNYSAPACVLFNKTVAENFGIYGMYDHVKNGTWTLDRMLESASPITAGSDVKRFMIGGAGGGLSMLFAAGFTLSSYDENGDPVLPDSLGNDMVSYIDKLADSLGDDSITYNQMRAYYNGAEQFVDTDTFENGRVLYWVDVLGTAVDMRKYDVEFGILPIPKRDENQKEYIGFANAWQVKGVLFPKNVKDSEMTGVITEAMAALSEKHVEPAYLEKSLKGRSTFDHESREVVDILYNNQIADLADTYQWADIVVVINKACLGVIDSYVSSYVGSVAFARIQIRKLLANVKNREG